MWLCGPGDIQFRPPPGSHEFPVHYENGNLCMIITNYDVMSEQEKEGKKERPGRKQSEESEPEQPEQDMPEEQEEPEEELPEGVTKLGKGQYEACYLTLSRSQKTLGGCTGKP